MQRFMSTMRFTVLEFFFNINVDFFSTGAAPSVDICVLKTGIGIRGMDKKLHPHSIWGT